MKETYKYLPAQLAQKLQSACIEARRPMAGLRQSRHHSGSLGASVEFAEYRDYQPGDPVNRIDWAVYARTDRLVIRQAYKEVNARCLVMLDISRSMNFQHDAPVSKLDYAKYLAAGMMFTMVKQEDSAGLITFDRKIRDRFEAVDTAAGLKPALKHLEKIKANEKGDIEAALHGLEGMVKNRSFVVLISDMLQDPSQILKGLHHLMHNGMDVTVFHILDPSELSLPMKGLTELTDMESGKKLTVNLDEIRDRYVKTANFHIERLRKSCLNMRMDYHFANTRTPVHELILKRSS